MALQFILGASGTGKTKYLYEMVTAQAKEHPERDYYFIVPEQFTLQTQKELVECNPSGGIFNIDVLSLARLAHNVFEELGMGQQKVLRDIGKSMVVKRALTECQKELQLFGANAGQTGFVEEAKSLLSELFQYGIDEKVLCGLIEEHKEEELLCRKLSDILLIYRKFAELLGEDYITSEGIYDALAKCVERSSCLKDCVVVLDGFTGFTPSQYALLKQFFAHARQVYVALTAENGKQNGQVTELFAMSAKTMDRIRRLAEEVHCEVLSPVVAGTEDFRHEKGSALRHLWANLFRYPAKKASLAAEREIRLYAGGDYRRECQYAVTKIQELLQKESYRYRDIAVIVSDINLYGEELVRAFTAAGIPCFLDYKKNMSENTFAEYIKVLLQVAENGITTEGVISYAKNALSGWEKEDAWDLENYCLALGIRGWQFAKEWKKTYRTHTEVSLERLNALRERVCTELEPLAEAFHGEHTVTDWNRTLFFFLKERGTEWLLKEKEEEFLEKKDRLRAREYAQVYRVTLELFDQLVELLGEEKLTPAEYRELVETGLKEAKVGLIPEGAEQIVIGDMERTRLKNIKALFFLGVNDGKVPSLGNTQGILSEKDRGLLRSDTVEFAPDTTEKMNNGQFYLYMNLTKPTQKLFLTYACVNEEGKAIRTSYLVGKIRSLFDGLEVRTSYDTAAEETVSNDRGRSAFLQGLREFALGEAQEEFAALYQWYANRLSEDRLRALLAAALEGPKKEELRPETAKNLYGEIIKGSVTRMEQYARCAFAHFLKYGMGLEERQEYELKAPDIGNLYHDGLKRFGEAMLAEGKKWQQITDEERERLAEQAAKAAVEAYATDIFLSSAKNRYLTKQIIRILKKTLQIMTVQLKDSDFSPAAFEQPFSHTDRNLRLYGIIDRLDISESEQGDYLKIVDYKSGSKDFSLEELYYGLSMQLAVYMTAAMQEREGRAIPGAMFYYHLEDPIVDKSDHVEEDVLKKLRVKGLVHGSTEAIRRLDHRFQDAAGGLAESVKSLKIPVETDKSGMLKKTSKVADRAQFAALSEFVYRKLQEETNEILSGAAAVAPFKLKKKTGCDYCPYASVCGFDVKCGGQYRILAPKTDTEVFHTILPEQEKGEA